MYSCTKSPRGTPRAHSAPIPRMPAHRAPVCTWAHGLPLGAWPPLASLILSPAPTTGPALQPSSYSYSHPAIAAAIRLQLQPSGYSYSHPATATAIQLQPSTSAFLPPGCDGDAQLMPPPLRGCGCGCAAVHEDRCGCATPTQAVAEARACKRTGHHWTSIGFRVRVLERAALAAC